MSARWTRAALTALALVGALVAAPVAPARAQASTAGPELLVNTTTAGYQQFPSLAMAADGSFLISWNSPVNDGSENRSAILARRFNADGTPRGGELQVNTTGTSTAGPAAAMAADGRFVVVWTTRRAVGPGGLYDVLSQRFAADGTRDGGEFQITVDTAPATYPQGFAAAMSPDGRFVVAWAGVDQNGVDHIVSARRYGADGTPHGDVFRVDTTDHGLYGPRGLAVAVTTDGHFVVAWVLYDGRVFIRRFAADGTPLGGEIHVNTGLAATYSAPAVGLAPDGRLVVAWTAEHQDNGTPGVYARRYGADDTPQGDEQRVNTFSASHQYDPDIAIANDGRHVVVWTSLEQDRGTPGVYGQHFAADGTPRGGEFRVNAVTAQGQWSPSIGMATDGRFAVTWTSEYQALGGSDFFSGYDIYARIAPWAASWNAQPAARADAYTLNGPALTVPASGVLANDTDDDSPTLTAHLASGPSGGTLTLNLDGSFLYTPNSRYAGTDRFTYVAHDGTTASEPATVTIAGSASACQPRPRVRLTPVAGAGRLDVRVEPTPLADQPPTSLTELRFGTFQNARVTLNGQPVASGQVVPLPPNTTEVGFSVARETPGQPTTVPVVVVDACGEWPTFVGGGTGAGF